VIASVVEVAMFFAVSNFTTVNLAAFFAARVAVGAAVRSGDGVIWGVSDPLCHPPITVPCFSLRGSLTPQMHVAVVRQNRALSLISPECAACVGRGVHVIRVDCERACQVLPENCVHIGERALALNLDPRRHRAVISCLSSNLRVSLITFVLSLSIAVAREWPSRREIVRRPRRRQATPLRSVPCGLAGLTAPRLRRRSSNYVMATGRLRTCSAVEIERCTRETGVMIRSREKRNRRPRRGTRRGAPRDHRDEPLRVFVRTLARQAAREVFERELGTRRQERPEVTVQ